jgi:hypothetical protein
MDPGADDEEVHLGANGEHVVFLGGDAFVFAPEPADDDDDDANDAWDEGDDDEEGWEDDNDDDDDDDEEVEEDAVEARERLREGIGGQLLRLLNSLRGAGQVPPLGFTLTPPSPQASVPYSLTPSLPHPRVALQAKRRDGGGCC